MLPLVVWKACSPSLRAPVKWMAPLEVCAVTEALVVLTVMAPLLVWRSSAIGQHLCVCVRALQAISLPYVLLNYAD